MSQSTEVTRFESTTAKAPSRRDWLFKVGLIADAVAGLLFAIPIVGSCSQVSLKEKIRASGFRSGHSKAFRKARPGWLCIEIRLPGRGTETPPTSLLGSPHSGL